MYLQLGLQGGPSDLSIVEGAKCSETVIGGVISTGCIASCNVEKRYKNTIAIAFRVDKCNLPAATCADIILRSGWVKVNFYVLTRHSNSPSPPGGGLGGVCDYILRRQENVRPLASSKSGLSRSNYPEARKPEGSLTQLKR